MVGKEKEGLILASSNEYTFMNLFRSWSTKPLHKFIKVYSRRADDYASLLGGEGESVEVIG